MIFCQYGPNSEILAFDRYSPVTGIKEWCVHIACRRLFGVEIQEIVFTDARGLEKFLLILKEEGVKVPDEAIEFFKFERTILGW